MKYYVIIVYYLLFSILIHIFNNIIYYLHVVDIKTFIHKFFKINQVYYFIINFNL